MDFEGEHVVHTCIIVDEASGSPIGLSEFVSTGDPKVSEFLNHLKVHPKINLRTVTPPEALHNLPPELALLRLNGNTPNKLRRIRADWRLVIDDCSAHYGTTRLSELRGAHIDSDNKLFMVAFCAIKHSAESTLHTIEENTVDRRGHKYPHIHPHPSVATSIRSKLKPPSTSAMNALLMQSERSTRPDAVYDGRPAGITGPSIAIYHPIFTRFQQRFSQTPSIDDIPETALTDAYAFIVKSAEYYASEPVRQSAIAPVVTPLLGPWAVFREVTLHYGSISFKPDGHRSVECGVFLRYDPGRQLMLNLIAEVKNGIGLGDRDPIEQAAKAYLIVATASELGKLRATSCMPAFLLGISGPNITVSGAIYVEGVITERLTDIISLVPVLSSQEPLGHPSARDQLAYRIAHLFICLQECLDQLADEYNNMSSLRATDDFALVPCPHFSSFRADDLDYKLIYRHRLFASRSERTVFFAEAQSPGQPPKDCVVKFASRYCAEAHNVVYTAGAAPRLLYCAFEPTVGKFCVVTEFVEEKESAQLTAEGVKTLRDAVKALHEH
ncbi:Protein kinase domain-containing protein, partial [Pleurotus pulmonarius]